MSTKNLFVTSPSIRLVSRIGTNDRKRSSQVLRALRNLKVHNIFRVDSRGSGTPG